MRLNRRLKKIEDIMGLNRGNSIAEMAENMSSEEAERIVKESMNKPREPLYVRTKKGYVDVYKIKDINLKGRITNDYIHQRIELYSKKQLDELGVEEAEYAN